MKSFKLVITLAVVLSLVAMTAFAAGVDGRKGQTTQGRAGFEKLKHSESDAPADRMKAGSAVRYDMTMARPEVETINAAALAKYPTVSASGLSGTYTIPGDFVDLASAAAVLNFVGLDGDVTFELANTSYNSGTVVIGGTYPNAGTYGVTITPAAGIGVTINFVTTLDEGKGFAFVGAKNVTIEGDNAGSSLTLGYASGHPFPTNDGFGATVFITGGSDAISVMNTHIKGNFDTPVWGDQTEGRSCAFVWTDEFDSPSTNITFDGCTFTDGTVGVKVMSHWFNGGWTSCENLTVTNSNFGGAFGNPLVHAIWGEVIYNPVVTNNNMMGLSFLVEYWDNVSTEFAENNVFGLGGYGNQNIWYWLGQTTAFHFLIAHGGLIDGNYIDGVTSDAYPGSGQGTSYGTRTYSYDLGYGGNYHTQISNNRFQNIFTDNGHMNLAVLRGPGFDAYHNSVRLTGNFTIGTPTTTALNACNSAYNNIFQNEITGSSAGNTRGMNVGGTVENNAIYSTGVYVAGASTLNAAASANANGIFGPTSFTWDLHADSTFPTAAQDIGKAFVIPLADIDAESRDTTFAGKRDAGADEFAGGALLGTDVFPVAITAPPVGGVPVGVPVAPKVTVKNNSPNAASFNMSLTFAPDGYSQVVAVSLVPGELKEYTFPNWTPTTTTTQTVTATTLLGGDITPGNDAISRSQTVQAPVVDYDFDFNAGAEGWTGAIDWKLKSSFAKLGGVNGGSGNSWVTERPNDISTYTEGAYASSQGYSSTYPGANILASPWLDISGLGGTDLYISFQHSIETEPLWDRSWMQYTVNGIDWYDLGVLNDPDGINWYNEDLYEHAKIDSENIDDATLVDDYGLEIPYASWTSNDAGTTGAPDDFIPQGPSGWVYAQLHVTSTSHPLLVGASAVRFRYIAFSDAVSSFGGWAFDNFKLTATDPAGSFLSGTIDGHAWTDTDGDGTDNGEADLVGTKVYISLFGSVVDSVVTNGTGDYSWSGVTLPAGYDVRLDVSGTAFTVPYGVSNTATVNHPSDASTKTQDFGTYVGSVSGKKFSDVNDNGANDSEPGLSGWTIELHQDSTHGTLVGSAVTDGSGNYTILAPPYANYVVKENPKSTARQTYPGGAGTHTVAVTGTSGGGSAVLTGLDFGNFIYGTLRVTLNIDLNGNGVKDIADALPIPAPYIADFKITKDGVGFGDSLFSLGTGTPATVFTDLDVGTYAIEEVATIPGWKRTKGGTHNFVLDASGEKDTATYLDFQYITISGTKFEDVNGDGVKDGGEPGLEGWTINVTGGVYDGDNSAVTDVDGNYSIDSIFTGTHTVAEVAQAGYTRTAPGGAGTYTVNGLGNTGEADGKNFGNYADATVSGIVYRDYNGNGTMDPEDTPMSGVTVDLAVNGGSDVSDGSGYSFAGLITDDTVRVTVPGGFVLTDPVAGEYLVSLTSGGTATGQNFGLFQSSDSASKYRTFTAEQYGADDQKKAAKAPKAGKAYDPVKNKPTTAYMVQSLIDPKKGSGYAVQVGLPGQNNAGGKEKGYFYPGKQGDFWKSLNNKSVKHTGMARGFDLDLKGKTILKRLKSFPPNKKQNNKLFAELAAFNMNLLASGKTTPAGLGVLIYSDPLSSLDGMTLDEIAGYADTVMTNYEFVPLGVYTELDSVVAKINGAFSAPAVDDTLLGWSAFPGAPYPTLTWAAYTSVQEVPFLKPNPGVSPVNRHVRTEQEVPSAFALEQNYPNPFNPTTTIEFDLPDESIVTLKIYNLLGQEVATLLDREIMDLGDAVEFDASTLPSGVYLYRIVAETIVDAESGDAPETFTQVKKMVLLK